MKPILIALLALSFSACDKPNDTVPPESAPVSSNEPAAPAALPPSPASEALPEPVPADTSAPPVSTASPAPAPVQEDKRVTPAATQPAAPKPAAVPQAPAAREPASAAPAPVTTSAPAPVPTDLAAGRQTYQQACAYCHDKGVAGAPKPGDAAAWSPRIAQGTDALYAAALRGKGAMPAQGGNPSLSDEAVKAAVDFLVAQSR